MWSLALSFPVAIWTTYFLICGILHTGIGIPLSDFYPFGASENDLLLGELMMEVIQLCWIKNFLSLVKHMTLYM